MNLDDLKQMLLIKENDITFQDNNTKERIALIKTLFENDNCFFDIDMRLAIDILWFLGISKENLLKTYYELTSPKNYKNEKIVELVNLDKI